MLAHDSKRLRFLHQLFHGTEGYLAATAKTPPLFVNLEVCWIPDMLAFIAERLATVMPAHSPWIGPKSPDMALRPQKF